MRRFIANWWPHVALLAFMIAFFLLGYYIGKHDTSTHCSSIKPDHTIDCTLDDGSKTTIMFLSYTPAGKP